MRWNQVWNTRWRQWWWHVGTPPPAPPILSRKERLKQRGFVSVWNLAKWSWVGLGNIFQAVGSTMSGFVTKNGWAEAKQDRKEVGKSATKIIDGGVDLLTTVVSEGVGGILEGKARALNKIAPKPPSQTSPRYGKTFRHLSRGLIKAINGGVDTAWSIVINAADLINMTSWKAHEAITNHRQQVIPLPNEIKNNIESILIKNLGRAVVDPFMLRKPMSYNYSYRNTKRR